MSNEILTEFLIERSKNGELWFVKKFDSRVEAEKCIDALKKGQPEIDWILTEKTTILKRLTQLN